MAVAFGLAVLLGFFAVKLKLPPLVGYLLTGILIGPHTRGFVGDVALAGQLAEIGVMLLMFGLGSARLFGVSFALGAFFAGLMMRESSLSQRAAQESLPLQDAFAVLFFVSVGMLFDPMIVIQQPLRVLAVAAIVMVASPLIALAFRYPLSTALTVAAGLRPDRRILVPGGAVTPSVSEGPGGAGGAPSVARRVVARGGRASSSAERSSPSPQIRSSSPHSNRCSGTPGSGAVPIRWWSFRRTSLRRCSPGTSSSSAGRARHRSRRGRAGEHELAAGMTRYVLARMAA